MKPFVFTLSVTVLLATGTAFAAQDQVDNSSWSNGTLRFRTSVYTMHFSHNPKHNNHQKLINLEYIRKDQWLIGAAYFRNSFDQPSEFLYAGRDFTLWQPNPDWRLRGTLQFGILHGYKGEYKHKVPFNSSGYAPAIVPLLGIEYKNIFLETTLFGTAGLMATVGFTYHLDN